MPRGALWVLMLTSEMFGEKKKNVNTKDFSIPQGIITDIFNFDTIFDKKKNIL
jgi:hypothetical protein